MRHRCGVHRHREWLFKRPVIVPAAKNHPQMGTIWTLLFQWLFVSENLSLLHHSPWYAGHNCRVRLGSYLERNIYPSPKVRIKHLGLCSITEWVCDLSLWHRGSRAASLSLILSHFFFSLLQWNTSFPLENRDDSNLRLEVPTWNPSFSVNYQLSVWLLACSEPLLPWLWNLEYIA